MAVQIKTRGSATQRDRATLVEFLSLAAQLYKKPHLKILAIRE